MAATKRNAGLTSAVPRATLNDEELVSVDHYKWYKHIYTERQIGISTGCIVYLMALLLS